MLIKVNGRKIYLNEATLEQQLSIAATFRDMVPLK